MSKLAVYVIVLAVSILISLAVYAHEAPSGWMYDQGCCSGRDCKEIPDDAVVPLPQGWGVKATNEVIPYEKAQRSPDGKFHRCSPAFANPAAKDYTICLYAPEPAT